MHEKEREGESTGRAVRAGVCQLGKEGEENNERAGARVARPGLVLGEADSFNKEETMR
jgi:hypothetical protein